MSLSRALTYSTPRSNAGLLGVMDFMRNPHMNRKMTASLPHCIMVFIGVAVCIGSLFLPGTALSSEIYKVVDKDGNVIFTDEPPGDGSEPMDLPPLTVIETEKPVAGTKVQEDAGAGAAENVAADPGRAELSRIYRDFKITQPLNEETFWGTANAVFVSWGSSTTPMAGMSVRLFVDGESQAAAASGGLAIMLDQGEHQVYAELLDARKRIIVAADPVTFYVKLSSAEMNSEPAAPGLDSG